MSKKQEIDLTKFSRRS